MKRITPVLLTAFSVLALSLPLMSHADDDGFLIFEATDATQAAPAEVVETAVQATTTEAAMQAQEVTVEAPTAEASANPEQAQEVAAKAPKAEKKVAKKAKKVKKAKKKVQKRAKRAERKKRTTRAKRNNLRKAKYYRIRKGDTLYRISVKSGVRLSRLVSLNKLYGSKKHKIQAGQRIRLR